ncbi:tRNA lysidine(34) synthetase TilS, partial [Xanthomonas hortorum]
MPGWICGTEAQKSRRDLRRLFADWRVPPGLLRQVPIFAFVPR